MTGKDDFCMFSHPLFSHFKQQKGNKNFFKDFGVTTQLNSAKDLIIPREQKRLPVLAGSESIFAAHPTQRVFSDFRQDETSETRNYQFFEPSLTRVHQNYQLVKKLGQGCFGSVYEARDKASGSPRAIKMVNPKRKTLLQNALKEAHILKQLSDSNCPVPKYYDSWIEGNKMLLIMECCESTLANEIKTRRATDTRFSESEIKTICANIVTSLKKLHELGYAHMDLKPDNILLASNAKNSFKEVCTCSNIDNPIIENPRSRGSSTSPRIDGEKRSYLLADFGICVSVDRSGSEFDFLEGDHKYMPLETLELSTAKRAQLDLTKVDIFSLGVILLQLTTGIDLPERGPEWSQIRQEDYTIGLMSKTAYSDNLKRVVIGCLRKEASQRLSLTQIISETFHQQDFSKRTTERREESRLRRKIELIREPQFSKDASSRHHYTV